MLMCKQQLETLRFGLLLYRGDTSQTLTRDGLAGYTFWGECIVGTVFSTVLGYNYLPSTLQHIDSVYSCGGPFKFRECPVVCS